jgi:hypothetical protein
LPGLASMRASNASVTTSTSMSVSVRVKRGRETVGTFANFDAEGRLVEADNFPSDCCTQDDNRRSFKFVLVRLAEDVVRKKLAGRSASFDNKKVARHEPCYSEAYPTL